MKTSNTANINCRTDKSSDHINTGIKGYYIAGNYPDKFTASGKAKIDSEEIVVKSGFINCGLPQTGFRSRHFKAYFRLICSILKASFSLPNNSVVFIQHPVSQNIRYIRMAKKRGNKVVVLVHDLNTLRDWSDKNEKEVLNEADVLIVHTESMKEWLIRQGLGKKYVVLEIFDYLHGSKVPHSESDKYRIAFAGNLGKSEFIDSLSFKNVFLNLYGIGMEKRSPKEGVAYKGCFPPDKLAENMEADFGLVWDGDSIDTCSGQLGEYLRLIAPHKLSMYLSAGLPVIVWKESAMAKFVEENKVGITINSLSELEELATRVSSDRYDKIQKNVKAISEKLSNGEYLASALAKAAAMVSV